MERLTENVQENMSAYDTSVSVKVEARALDRARPEGRGATPQARRRLISIRACQELDWGSAEDLARLGKVDVLIAADVVFGLDNPGASQNEPSFRQAVPVFGTRAVMPARG